MRRCHGCLGRDVSRMPCEGVLVRGTFVCRRRLSVTCAVYRVFLFGLCALGLIGCAGSGTKRLVKTSPFTKPEELARLQQREVKVDKLIAEGGLRVSEWTLAGPLPTKVGIFGLQTPKDDLEGAMLEAVSKSKNKNVRATQGMACMTRELATFMLRHDDQLPDDGLKSFMRHRCGLVASSVSSSYWSMDLSPGEIVDANKLGREFYDQVKENVARALEGGGHGEVGIAMVQHEQKVMVLLSMGYRKVTVNSFDMIPGEDQIEVVGEVHVSASGLRGAITEGDFGANSCVVDSRVPLPKFRMTCPVNRADQQAVFELYASREESILSTLIFDQRVWPAGLLKAEYAPSAIRAVLKSGEVPAGDREQMYLAYVNKVRQAAGVAPLSLAEAQSQSVKALLPNFLAAQREEDDVSVNKITMGLMAGWEVSGDILDANFRVASVSDGKMVSLAEDIMDSPSGRRTLLDADGSTFAVGEIQEGSSSLGAMMLVYEFVPQETYIRRLARAWRTINTARTLSKKSPFKRSKKVLSSAEKISARMESGALGYEDGVNQLQDVVNAAYGNTGVYTYTYLTHELDDFSLHGELLSAKGAEAVVMVTPMTIEGYPWTIYSVVICIPASRFKK